ncbi:hypothetical protein Tco_0547983 [Tanacetum coccineum]
MFQEIVDAADECVVIEVLLMKKDIDETGHVTKDIDETGHVTIGHRVEQLIQMQLESLKPLLSFTAVTNLPPFWQHVINKLRVQLHSGHGHLDVTHVVDELGKPDIEHLHIVPYTLCISVIGQNRLEVVLDLDVRHLYFFLQEFPKMFSSKKVLHQFTSRCLPHSLYPDNTVEFVIAKMQNDADNEMFDVNVLNGEEVFVAGQNENVVEEVVDVAQVSTPATTVTIITEEITLAQALEALKTSKPKVKGIVFQEPSTTTTITTISSQQSHLPIIL